MIRVKYSLETSKVLGNYPDFMDYPNNTFDLDNRTIDGLPFIEISQDAFNQNNGKTMSVADGVYKEFELSDADKFAFAKEEKIKQINDQRDARLNFTTPQTVTIYAANEDLANLEFEINDQCLAKWESRIRHLRDLEAAGEENATMPWIAVDTKTYWLNAAAYASLVAHLIDRQNTEHVQARKRKNAVLDLTILEEVLAYDITQVYID